MSGDDQPDGGGDGSAAATATSAARPAGREPRVFISYRHEPGVQERVVEMGRTLRAHGILVELDVFANDTEFDGAGPDIGWPGWCAERVEKAERVLIVGTPGWFAVADPGLAPTLPVPDGTGMGAASEAKMLSTRLYEAYSINSFCRIVKLDDFDLGRMPLLWRPFHRLRWATDAEQIARWLKAPPKEIAALRRFSDDAARATTSSARLRTATEAEGPAARCVSAAYGFLATALAAAAAVLGIAAVAGADRGLLPWAQATLGGAGVFVFARSWARFRSAAATVAARLSPDLKEWFQ